MKHTTWRCEKCQGVDYEVDEFRATGGSLAKIFDVQNKKFSTVSCSHCGYTEIYKRTTSMAGNVFDFLTG